MKSNESTRLVWQPETYLIYDNIPRDRETIHSLTNFILRKFFTKKRLEKMSVRIEFYDDLYKKTKMLGSCIWEDTHFRPYEFTIELETKQSFISLLNTLTHELVHVKQMAKGEFFELTQKRHDRTKLYKFNGKVYNPTKIKYLDQPWEIEAVGRSINLIIEWCVAENKDLHSFIPKDLIYDD